MFSSVVRLARVGVRRRYHHTVRLSLSVYSINVVKMKVKAMILVACEIAMVMTC
ncbi:hypothetical protein F383_09716 [Gossypium arboreum]|uniref:Uncharacterized protein n=1 Tax=Gossypium arboreum TaxID=29729 RepID=A0A0B0P5A5_GOSAR|nr:hypothetical protein F383_09716 [Gossypium arboreum]